MTRRRTAACRSVDGRRFDARGGRRAPSDGAALVVVGRDEVRSSERRGRVRPGAVKPPRFVGVNRSDAPVERGSGKNEGSRTVKSARSDVPRRPARLLRFERARADGFRAPREFERSRRRFFQSTPRARPRGRPRREGARRSATRKEGTESARHRGRRVRGHRAIRAGSVGASSAETTMAPSTRRRSSASNNAAPGDKKKVLKDVTNGGRGALPRKIPDAGPPTAPVADHGVGARTRSSRKKPPASVRRAHRRRTCPRRGRARGGEGGAGEAGGEVRAGGGLEARQEQAQGASR